jgi:hypothetical protein
VTEPTKYLIRVRVKDVEHGDWNYQGFMDYLRGRTVMARQSEPGSTLFAVKNTNTNKRAKTYDEWYIFQDDLDVLPEATA